MYACAVHDEQLVPNIPVEKLLIHDVPVDVICTPTQIIHTNTKIPKPTGEISNTEHLNSHFCLRMSSMPHITVITGLIIACQVETMFDQMMFGTPIEVNSVGRCMTYPGQPYGKVAHRSIHYHARK